jgi:hypothetical protein
VELVLITKPPRPRTVAGEGPAESSSPGYLIVITLRIQYEVGDAAQFYGGTQDPKRLLDEQANYLLLTWARRQTVDELLAVDQDALTGDIRAKLNERLDAAGAGLRVRSVILMWVHPPVKEIQPKGAGVSITVAKAYQSIAAAREAYKTRVLDAVAYRNATLPAARAEAFAIRQEARVERESKGYRSDLLVFKPVAHVGTPVMETADAVFLKLPAQGELRVADDLPVAPVEILHPPDDPEAAVPVVRLPWGMVRLDSDVPLAAGDLIEWIPRQLIEPGTLTVRPLVEHVECRVTDDSDPKAVTVEIDYEYRPGFLAGEVPRTQRIDRRRIERIVRGGSEGRMSSSQSSARGFVALADVYNQSEAYQRLFRLPRRYAALAEALAGTRKVIVGRAPVELRTTFKTDTMGALKALLSEPEGEP